MNPYVIIVPSELFVGIELYAWWIEFDWISCTKIKRAEVFGLIYRRIIEERLQVGGGIHN